MNKRHWTARSTDAFIQRITFDYVTQLIKRLDSLPMSQAELAKILGVSEGSVSQTLNIPRNPTIKKIVTYARALGLKVALVAYDDSDPDNERGPINSEIFSICWERANRPADFLALNLPANPVSDSMPFNQEYVTVSGRQWDITPRAADSSTGNALREVAPNLVLLCKLHQSTAGKPTLKHEGNTPLRLVS